MHKLKKWFLYNACNEAFSNFVLLIKNKREGVQSIDCI